MLPEAMLLLPKELCSRGIFLAFVEELPWGGGGRLIEAVQD